MLRLIALVLLAGSLLATADTVCDGFCHVQPNGPQCHACMYGY